ncbi:peroxiredoxin family protein [Aquimarina sp. M1]
MKRLYILLSLSIVLFISCKEHSNEYDEVLNKELKGLTKLSTEDMVRLSPIKWEKETTPLFFLKDGTKLTTAQFNEKVQTSTYHQVFFANAKDQVKAVVLESQGDQNRKLNQRISKQPIDIGELAPEFEVTDINGNSYNSKDLLGKVIVINFWFINCPPCRKEIPDLNKLVDTFKDDEVIFLGFATDSEEKLQKFLKKNQFSYHHISVNKLVNDFGVKGFPTNIIIDKKGKISLNKIGGRDDIYELMKTKIEELL